MIFYIVSQLVCPLRQQPHFSHDDHQYRLLLHLAINSRLQFVLLQPSERDHFALSEQSKETEVNSG